MTAVTRESVFAAANMLVEAGESPTLQAIRRKLGGGSYSTISGYMQEWRSQSKSQAILCNPTEQLPVQLQTQFQKVVNDLWVCAQNLADSKLESERGTLSDMQLNAKNQIKQAIAIADDAVIQLEQLRSELAATKNELLNLSIRLAASESLAKSAIEERDRLSALLAAAITEKAKKPTSTKASKNPTG